MKRVLTSSGKFAPFKGGNKKSKKIVKKIVQPADEKNNAKKEDIKDESNESSSNKKFILNGEETNQELKAMLNEVGVEYPKSAKKAKLLDLMVPFISDEEEGEMSDL